MSALLTRMVSLWLDVPCWDDKVRELAGLLALPDQELLAIRTNPLLCYRPFAIRKRGGGIRHIVAPSSPLKLLQRRFLHRYLAHQPIHNAATAFRSGSSIATHARRHLGQAIVLTADLVDFFPSTAARRIRRCFRDLGWQGDALEALMRLCVYRGGLPQGAPTSPALSNLVNRRLDEELSDLAATHTARYSRYCDDLAFSWGTDVEPPGFRRRIEDRLGRFGYRIQPAKGWRLQLIDERPEITGIILDGRRLRLSDTILRRIRHLKSGWFTRDPSVRKQLEGYRGLRKMLKR